MAITQIKTTGIADDAVTVAKMADNSIDSAQYVDGSIDTAHIADSQITVAKMAANSIDSDQYVDGSIDTAHIADSQITSAKIADGTIATGDIADDAVTADKVADNAIDVARLNVSDGSAGQSLTTNGSGALAFATIGGAYSDWTVLTSNTNLAHKGQYISNKASALTHTLPSGSAGSTVILKATGGGPITIARTSSQKINSIAADGTLLSGNAIQLVFVDATIGWLEL
jgi:hypothetical protein